MDLEKRVRDNLNAAAEALTVPEPNAGVVAKARPRRASRLTVVLAGAAAVTALVAVPVILMNLGGPDVASPLTSVGSTTTIVTTTTMPTTTTADSPGSTLGSYGLILEDTGDGDVRMVIAAERIDVEDPPTATIRLLALPAEGDEPLGEAVVGDPGGFFWNSVVGPAGVCTSDFSSTTEAVRLTFQIRLSASLGCSAPYAFEVRDDALSEVQPSAEAVANLFMSVWSGPDQTMMTSLASPDAVEQANALGTPTRPVLTGCEGAAGSVYCTWADDGRDLIVRVDNVDQPPIVVEVRENPQG